VAVAEQQADDEAYDTKYDFHRGLSFTYRYIVYNGYRNCNMVMHMCYH